MEESDYMEVSGISGVLFSVCFGLATLFTIMEEIRLLTPPSILLGLQEATFYPQKEEMEQTYDEDQMLRKEQDGNRSGRILPSIILFLVYHLANHRCSKRQESESEQMCVSKWVGYLWKHVCI